MKYSILVFAVISLIIDAVAFAGPHIPASAKSPAPFIEPEQKNEQVTSDPTQEINENYNKTSGYITPLIGLAFPVSNVQGGPYFIFGGEVGIHTEIIDIGFFGNTLSNSESASGIKVSGSLTLLMLSLTNQTSIFYYGGRFGLGIRNVSASGSGLSLSSSGTAFAVAPVVGIRIPVRNNISFDAEISWQVVAQGDISGSLGSATLTSVGYLVPLVGIRIGF